MLVVPCVSRPEVARLVPLLRICRLWCIGLLSIFVLSVFSYAMPLTASSSPTATLLGDTSPASRGSLDRRSLVALLDDDAEVDALLDRTLPALQIDPTAFPTHVRDQVVKHLRQYAVVSRAQLQDVLARAAPYLALIRSTLHAYGVPQHFAYVPIIESAFQVEATHPRSGAAGLWQLMGITARTYGLRVTKQIDERLDPMLATSAAARYLRDLQAMFGADTPLLMLAAYNYGEYNLSKAIARTRTRDIWRLAAVRQLPSETREYLVKTIALWVVLTHAERLELRMDAPEPPLSYLELTFHSPVSLVELAQQLNIDYTILRSMNPHLLAEHVPELVPIYVPPHGLHTTMHVEVRLSPQALQNKQCCARLHLLHPTKTAHQGLEAIVPPVKTMTPLLQPTPLRTDAVLTIVSPAKAE